jgi:hypothetical protein
MAWLFNYPYVAFADILMVAAVTVPVGVVTAVIGVWEYYKDGK